MNIRFPRSRLRRIHILLSLSLLIAVPYARAQTGLRMPPPPQMVQLFDDQAAANGHSALSSVFFTKKPLLFKRYEKLDSTDTYLTISEKIADTEFKLPLVVDLETYVRLRSEYNWRHMLLESARENLFNQKEDDFGAFQLDIPFRIKSETFTRIFGSDKISLRVTGNITFDLSGRTEDRSGSAINARENQSTFSPRFSQTQQFTVEGRIGEKVTVSVQQNSEAVTDIENTLKLRYDGDEDEIVQKIEAGNVSLSLPSTKYVIFGGSNQGLFGLKSQMQLGNLKMTSIASLEKGQQQELKISGNSSSSTTIIKDIDYIQNRYFFIDRFYRDVFEDEFTDDLQQFQYFPGKDVFIIEVWKSINPQGVQGARFGLAAVNPDSFSNVTDISGIDSRAGSVQKGYFIQLEENEYSFDRFHGILTINQQLDAATTLAVAFRTTDNSLTPGTLTTDIDPSAPLILKMIKERDQNPTSPIYADTWDLMMKNIYSLGGTNIEKDGFEIRLEYNKAGEEQTHQGDVSFLNLVGLDIQDENGNPIEGGDDKVDMTNPAIINRAQGIVMFPSLQPFDPLKNSRFNGLDDKYRIKMYNVTTSRDRSDASGFRMLVTSKSTKSSFDLGFYVLEGSEVVNLNGRKLERDKDYLIDYFSGQLTLISEEAKRSSADLEIKYERANLFQLDKKTILGTRMEYDLGDIGFIGFTALYLDKSTLDTRVRVGQEPFQNFVWDLNAAFKFKPRFITEAIDALPLVETSAESNIDIEGEFAQVFPDPNTLDNPDTDDNNGVAYIDDFESSKRSTTLGIRYKTWTYASPPAYMPELGPVDDVQLDKSRAHLTWFNPYNQVLIKDIWPERDVNAQTGQTTDVLGFEFFRDPESDPDSAWVGVMRSNASFPDQQKTKYIEMWVKGYHGRVHIDIGKISEDWYLRDKEVDGKFYPAAGFLNTEDKNLSGTLDEGEDVGLDGLKFGTPGADTDDLWKEPNRNARDKPDGVDYTGLNGLEGNGNARGARYPDTEDLDGDGQLNTTNAYFEYSFSLDTTDVEARNYIAGSTPKGWRLFRIPVRQWNRKVGLPDTTFQQILYSRVWLDQLPTEPTRILIATLDFVGNEWEEEGYAVRDIDNQDAELNFVKDDSIFVLATYNNEENKQGIPGLQDAYVSPPGVSGQRDRITRTLSKEQSLAMRLRSFPVNGVAEARKQLYSKMELINYKRLKLFLYGSSSNTFPSFPEQPEDGDSPLQFYLRFGADKNNYYEYGQDVFLGWNKRNQIDINLEELLKVKNLMSEYRDLQNEQRGYFKSKGLPSLKTVRYFVVGVRNVSGMEFNGEVWLNELRLTDVRQDNATAMRLKTNIKLADVLRVTAEWESKDADFHNVGKQFGEGNTVERQSYSGKLNLDKFLPAEWDMSIPIDARASFSRNIPKYLPKSDQLTGYKNNTFADKLKSLFGLKGLPSELEDDISSSETIGAGTTISKRSKSKNWFLRYSLDQFVFDFDYARQNRSSWDIKFNRSEKFKESYRYKIPFASDNYIMPFKFAKTIPVLSYIYDTKFYYTPSNLAMNMTVSDNKTESLRRDSTAVLKTQRNTSTLRTITGAYKMFDRLNFNYSRKYTTDADFDSISRTQLYKNIVTKFDFGRETDIGQTFKATFKPNLVSWLKTDFSYDSNFRYQLTNSYKYKSATNRVAKRVGLTLSPGKLMQAIYKPKSGKKTGSKKRRRRPRKKKNDEKKTEEKKKEEKSSFEFPNPLMWAYDFIVSWKSVKINYNIDNNQTDQFIAGLPKWDYQFGFTRNPGVGQDTALVSQGVNLVRPSFTENKTIRTSTSYNFGRSIRASFNHEIRSTFNSTDGGRTKTGGETSTFFFTGDDPLSSFKGTGKDLRLFVPDWTVQISNLEKYLFFKEFANSITIDHGHSGKYDQKSRLAGDGVTFEPYQQTFSDNWQPLIGLNIRTKWGISATARMTNSKSYSYSVSGGASKTENQALTVSLNYQKKTGFKIPIPIWPFKGRTFKNEINFALTFDSSKNRSFIKQAGLADFVEQQNNTSWKLRPSATYKFNTRVQGSLFFETGATTNKISGKYSYSEFGINVNISIRD